jgi:transcriptional regulator with XRE-family HTH domain
VASLQDLSEMLADLRKSCGNSFRTLGGETGINPGTLISMEHGRHWPLLNTAGRLLQWYGVTATIGWNPIEKENSGSDYAGGKGQ